MFKACLFAALAATGALAATSNPIEVNPDNADIGLTTGGSDFLWAVFAVMLISDLIFIAWSLSLPVGKRVFHQIPIIILTTATIAYFSLASNLGNTPITTEFRENGTRTIWYVRYIDWVITTPLLLLELLLGTGLSLSEITVTIFFDLAMIVTGLVGALVASRFKWGYFVFGCFCEFYIWWVLIGPGRTTAGLLGPEVRKAFTNSALMLSFLWALYPIAWGLCDGGNVINVPGEMIFYGTLDILAKPVFCFFHVAALKKIPFEQFRLAAGNLHGAASTGYTDEKAHLRASHPVQAQTSRDTAPVHPATAPVHPTTATDIQAGDRL